MELTNRYTKTGNTFVHKGANLIIRNGNKHYPNVQHETLLSLGYHQVAIDRVEVPSLYTNGFEERDGVTYWVEYAPLTTEPEVEPEND